MKIYCPGFIASDGCGLGRVYGSQAEMGVVLIVVGVAWVELKAPSSGAVQSYNGRACLSE